jgi:hypothetical protein
MYSIDHSCSFSVKVTPVKLLVQTTVETKMLVQKNYIPEVDGKNVSFSIH